jgi:subtilisin family serine protease
VVTDASATATGGLSTACAALPAGSLTNEIAVVSRGTCNFIDKVRNTYAAGAVGVIVVNNQPGDPIAMGNNSESNIPPIPGYMIGLSDRAAIMAQEGQSATLVKVGFYQHDPAKDMITYSASSWGPTGIDYRVKPNLVAPGENVLSSVPHHACATPPCFAFFNGTSMASPHLAGTAAIVRQLHPTWTAAQVRSAIANTADLNKVRAHNIAGNPITNDVNRIGNGLLNVADAINAKVAIEPVNISFDAIPAGSGQSRTRAVKLTNLTGSSLPLSVSVRNTTGTGVTFTLDTASATLAPGASKVVNVTATATKSAAPRVDGYQAWLWLEIGGTEVAHAPLFTYVK